MDDELLAWLRDYKPHGVDRGVWDDGLGEFVRQCMIDLNPKPEICKRYARVLANHSAWCQQEGLPLDREVILTPDVVEYYTARGLADDPSRATYRADLRRICPRLTKRAPWRPRPKPIPRRHIAAPYTETQVEMLWRFVTSQSTAKRQRLGRAVFLLGLGAGLDGRWLPAVTADDVRRVDGHLVVDVSGDNAPRTVPVLRALEDRMELLLDHYGDGKPLVGYESKAKNALSNHMGDLHIPGELTFAASRLRSTWLHHHLVIGTRLPDLIQAAGLKSPGVLSELVSTIPPYPFSKYCEELSGDQWTFTS